MNFLLYKLILTLIQIISYSVALIYTFTLSSTMDLSISIYSL